MAPVTHKGLVSDCGIGTQHACVALGELDRQQSASVAVTIAPFCVQVGVGAPTSSLKKARCQPSWPLSLTRGWFPAAGSVHITHALLWASWTGNNRRLWWLSWPRLVLLWRLWHPHPHKKKAKYRPSWLLSLTRGWFPAAGSVHVTYALLWAS